MNIHISSEARNLEVCQGNITAESITITEPTCSRIPSQISITNKLLVISSTKGYNQLKSTIL